MPARSASVSTWAFALLLALGAACAACSQCAQGTPSRSGAHPVFSSARDSIFALGGQQAGIQGTAFLVRHRRKRYLVSSFHVVAKLTRPFAQTDAGERFGDLTVLAVDRRHDVVVLDGQSIPARHAGLTCAKDYVTSQAVFLMGYPAMGWDTSHLNFSAGVISDARYNAPELFGRGSVEYIQATTPINLGHSGSPLLNQAAEVLGVVAWRFEPNSEIQAGNYAVPIQHALALIDGLPADRTAAAPADLHPTRGQVCAQDDQCEGLDFCLQATCQALRSDGQACQIDEDCFLPLVCHQGRCTPQRSVGQACDGDYLCKPPLVCVLGACRPIGLVGEACGRDQDCDWPLVCAQGRCAKGAARAQDDHCPGSPG
jgi:hypothetical protein